MEVLCFVLVAKLVVQEKGLFVSNRNWGFGRRRVPGRLAGNAGVRALDRRLVVFDIFTDSSSSVGARNTKGCVCIWPQAGEESVWRLEIHGLSDWSRNLTQNIGADKDFETTLLGHSGIQAPSLRAALSLATGRIGKFWLGFDPFLKLVGSRCQDVLQRDPFLRGDAAAVFVFGRGVQYGAVHARDFHAHFAEGRFDRD